ncbi:hypothetical protein GCM10010193_41100 [Kitasatospora atroaurantiaca]|uniref:Uncharacterized protein n=1 Tax=Kitasatospora atroaurantiaca TaxID=285545 RepID=A0A561F1C2_9ACTN|nr:hypothetical protein [Kitasatospora atroaurantiaca]TWE21663.1 hypothetical protein FB465_6861 [Kitasatospora atroaurantiaca]
MGSNSRPADLGRICMARTVGRYRGEGLGNEIFPWAKAYLASRELGFGLLPPPWGLNRRGYWKDFGTSRLDWFGHRALRAVMPTVTVTDEMIRSTGETDYGAAIRVLDAEFGWSQRRSLLLVHRGMSGGLLGIARSRNYFRNTLLGRLPHVSLEDHQPGSDRIHVAVHVRLGDFEDTTATGPGPGDTNESLPAEWYRSVLSALREQFGEMLHVEIMSDDPSKAARLLPEWSRSIARPRRTLEDLSVMAAADLLVCSISTFSMLAAFLSDAPYIWFRPHLDESEGFLSIWGFRPEQRTGRTAANIRQEQRDPSGMPARGAAMGMGDDVPAWLADYLRMRVALRRRSADLIHFGAIPKSSETVFTPSGP